MKKQQTQPKPGKGKRMTTRRKLKHQITVMAAQLDSHQTRKQLNARVKDAEAKVKELWSQLATAETVKKELIEDLAKLRAQLAELNEQLATFTKPAATAEVIG